MYHTASVVTISCNADDCQDSVRAIAESVHSATYEAAQLARYDGWESFEGTNSGTFHRCPIHRSEFPAVSLVKTYA
jgi:hypothetical protein